MDVISAQYNVDPQELYKSVCKDKMLRDIFLESIKCDYLYFDHINYGRGSGYRIHSSYRYTNIESGPLYELLQKLYDTSDRHIVIHWLRYKFAERLDYELEKNSNYFKYSREIHLNSLITLNFIVADTLALLQDFLDDRSDTLGSIEFIQIERDEDVIKLINDNVKLEFPINNPTWQIIMADLNEIAFCHSKPQIIIQ